MNRKNETVRSVVLGTVRRQPLLCTALVLAVAGAVAASLLPPLVLGRVVDRLTARQAVPFALALGYFGLLALSGGLDSLRESLLTVFGQRMTHALRSAMCAKLDKLPAEAFVNQESGAAVSRFVGDVDTVEELFTSGIISMFADACRLCGILAVIFADDFAVGKGQGNGHIAAKAFGSAHAGGFAAAVSLYPRGAKADAESAAAKPCRCGAGFRPCAGNAALHPHHPHPAAGKLHGKSL